MNTREYKYYRQGLLTGQEWEGAAHGALVRAENLSNLLGTSPQEAVRRVIEDYHQRLDALPSTVQFPELQGMRECVLVHHKGLSEAAGITRDDVILTENYLSFVTRALSVNTGAQTIARGSEPGCTLAYFPGSDRGPLIANNTDDPYRPGYRVEPVWLVANRAGLILGTVSNGLFDDEISPELFPAPVFLMVYEMCSTTAEAVDLLTRLNLFWGPCNLLIADRFGESAIIEKSSCRYGLRPGSDGFSATTAMAAEEPNYKSYLWQTREQALHERGLDHTSCEWAYWKAAESRSSRLLHMVEEAKHNPTFAALENIIYDHTGEPDQIHLDGGKCHPDEEVTNWTLRTVLHVLDEHCAFYSFAEPPLGGHLTPRHRKDFAPVQYVF